MPFHYLIKPSPTGSNNPFSARPDPQPTVEADEFLDDIAARASIDRAVVEKVLLALFASIHDFLRETRPVAAILGLFRVLPTCGGSYPTADPDDNAIRKTCDFTLNPLPAVHAAFQENLSLQKAGQVGPVIPVLDSVMALPSQQANKYAAAAGLEIRGRHLRQPGAASPMPTAQFTDPDGTKPTDLTVLDASNRRASIALPSGISGPKLLLYSDGEHTVTYTATLQPI